MKILLIYPPNLNHIKSVLPEAIEEERGNNPPLGLLYLAGYIQKYSPEFKIKILDCTANKIDYELLRKEVELFEPDIVGLTVMSFTLIDSLKTSHLIKAINTNIKIVFGGPHVNIYPRETLELGGVDFIVLGEGEKTFFQLINNIKNEQVLKEVPGLAFFDSKNNYVNTGRFPFIENLDELPYPARNLIDNSKYSSVLGTNKLVTTMMTSRGCPYKCLFCDRPHLGKIFRARSAENVVGEIEDSMKFGIKEFLMYDDTFTINRQRVFDICDKILEKKLDIIWDIRARVNTIDKELLIKLKEAGCARIHYGVESGTQKILNTLNKGITLEQVVNAFKLTRDVGIETLGYFMIGNPGETKEDIEKTLDFALKIKADYVHITITMPFPATGLYKNALENKIITNDVWLEYAKNPTQNFTPPTWNEILSNKELSFYINKAYRKFYFRPGYIINRVLKVRSFNEFFTKAKAGIKMLSIKR